MAKKSNVERFLDYLKTKPGEDVCINEIMNHLDLPRKKFQNIMGNIYRSPFLEVEKSKQGPGKLTSHVKLIHDKRPAANDAGFVAANRNRKAKGLIHAPECYKWSA